MKRRRILEIIPTLDQSGAEKQMTLLATGLPKEDFEVAVCVLTRSGPYEKTLRENGIPVTLIGKSSKCSFRAFWRLKNEIRRFQPDLVHTWIFAANAYGRKAALDCGVRKIVCGERCVDPWKRAWHFAIDRYLARKTDRIAVNGEGTRDFYVAHGLPADKFVVIPNGITPLPASPVSRRELLAELGIPIEEGRPLPFLIGLVARLWPQKRIQDAIWAAEQLKFTETDFHLLILGDGPQRENLLRYRDEIRIHDRVHFLGHRSDVPRFLPHFDLLWATSEYEGLSNVVMEAMSVGIPVIASDIPGHRELVVPDVTGVLIPEHGGDATRRRTDFCRESFFLLQPDGEERRKRMGEAARKRMANEFSVQKMIDRYAELYRSLIDQDSPS